MKRYLYLDFETRSPVDIRAVGAYPYVSNPATMGLLLAYAYDDGPVVLLDLFHDPDLPVQLIQDIQNPSITKVAWNAPFERGILNFCFHVPTIYAEWEDPALLARYASLPGHLKDASKALDLGEKGKRARRAPS